MKFEKQKVEVTTSHKENLNRYTPGLFVKLGVGLNIAFCAILSIPIVTLPLTIPAIVLNAILLVPYVDVKRRFSIIKWIAMILTVFLTAIVSFIVFFSVTSLEGLLNGFMDFIDQYVIFWTRKDVIRDTDITFWLKTFEIIFVAIGVSGSVFLILGRYKPRKIGMVEVEDVVKKKKKSKEVELKASKSSKSNSTSISDKDKKKPSTKDSKTSKSNNSKSTTKKK